MKVPETGLTNSALLGPLLAHIGPVQVERAGECISPRIR